MQLKHRCARGEDIGHRHPGRCHWLGLHRRAGAFAGEAQDLRFRCSLGIADADIHQEAVQLRLRQGEGAFLLDRVLGGHDQEQRGQRVGVAAHRDLAFAHRLKQRGLHLGRRAVDLVGKQDRVEDGAGLELEAAILGAPDFRASEVRGQQVGGELHACKVRFQARGQGTDGGGLGESGSAFDQQMAIGEQGDQQAFHQRGLADDLAREVIAQRAKGLVQAGNVGAGRIHGVLAMQAEFDLALPQRFACRVSTPMNAPRDTTKNGSLSAPVSSLHAGWITSAARRASPWG